jgi:peptidoglycan hydrolase CwlO-like protein
MTVIGLAVTQLKGSTGYFGIPWLAIVGCVLLSNCVMVSICYLCVVHASEYDKLAEQSWKQRKLLRDLRTLNKELHGKAQSFDAYVVAKNALIVSMEQENSEGEAPKAGWFRAINVTTLFFVVGLVCVALSIFL